MSMIKCPECGHQISDKAPVCPNCGVEIAGKITKCPQCGEVYFNDQGTCPNCHHLNHNTCSTNKDAGNQEPSAPYHHIVSPPPVPPTRADVSEVRPKDNLLLLTRVQKMANPDCLIKSKRKTIPRSSSALSSL